MVKHLKLKLFKNTILKVLCLSLVMALIGELLLVASSAIPDQLIYENISQGIDIVRNKEGYVLPQIYDYTDSSKLDNYTDREMFNLLLEPAEERTSILQQAQVPYYSRYWQGYIVFLKPLFVFLNYTQIRYLYMFVHVICLTVLLILLAKKVTSCTAINMAISMCFAYFIILPYSLQYSSVFFVMYLASIGLLMIPDFSKVKIEQLILYFWIVGSVTNYVDFLTTPLITLGIPLAIVVLRNTMDKENMCSGGVHLKHNMLYNVFILSVSWCGYFVMWIMKWILGSIILHQNIILDAIHQANMRISSKDEDGFDSFSRLATIKLNIYDILPDGITFPKYKIMAIILIYLIALYFFHKSKREILNLLPLLIIAGYPYVWYIVLTNHSNIHHFFTYRNQLISIFCILSFMLHSISFEQIKDKILKKKNIAS